MKKYLSIVLVAILLLVSASAFAESFTLHGGVTFNMTVDEMVAQENSNGLKPVAVTDNKLTLASEWGANHTYKLDDYSAVYEVSGSFVSDSFKTIYYMFDKEGLLCQMIYCGTSCYSGAGNVANINDALADLFVNKYGAPSNSPAEIASINSMRDLPSMKVPDDGFFKYDLSLTNSYYQWLYPADGDIFVDIEIQGLKWVMYATGSDKYPAYSTVVGYTRTTLEECDKALQDKQDAVAQTMDDI